MLKRLGFHATGYELMFHGTSSELFFSYRVPLNLLKIQGFRVFQNRYQMRFWFLLNIEDYKFGFQLKIDIIILHLIHVLQNLVSRFARGSKKDMEKKNCLNKDKTFTLIPAGQLNLLRIVIVVEIMLITRLNQVSNYEQNIEYR